MERRYLRPGRAVRAAVLIAAGLAGCGQDIAVVQSAPIAPGPEAPTLSFEGFRMVSTKTGAVEWEMDARDAQINERTNVAHARDIRIRYWKDGGVMSTLTAQRGSIDTQTNDMTAEGNVVMVSRQGETLRTERLRWDHIRQKIITDQPVQVDRRDSILTGVGLEADSELERIQVLSKVQIKIKSLKGIQDDSESH